MIGAAFVPEGACEFLNTKFGYSKLMKSYEGYSKSY